MFYYVHVYIYIAKKNSSSFLVYPLLFEKFTYLRDEIHLYFLLKKIKKKT